MSFSSILRQRRLEAGLKLRPLARAVGVDAAYLSRVETGAVPPSDHLLKSLAWELGMSVEEIFLLAGRLPESLRHLIEKQPRGVAAALGSLAEMVVREPGSAYGGAVLSSAGKTAIEDDFPFAELSDVAEAESWRKEVYRPIYHMHKWWAQRLGSVFRALLLAASVPKGSAVMDLFYQPVRLPAPVVFDPFMGSGTTVGEAHKLGCTAIGRDINPVAYRAVRVALSVLSRRKLERLFDQLERTVGERISSLYRAVDDEGRPCSVLYFFWVMTLPCPHCDHTQDLFSSHVFASHAYPKRHPKTHVLCPSCGDVFAAAYGDPIVGCPECRLEFEPAAGPVHRGRATCDACAEEFRLSHAARASGRQPSYRLYAKLVLRSDGSKAYLRVTERDLDSHREASRMLRRLSPPVPRVRIRDGYNTRQVLSYGFSSWDQLFNARQQLALGFLASGISELEDCAERDTLYLLFSGLLEFNNMFASYKGEGTGAVRPVFSHHVLKPERTPIEANLWGTEKSSGSFSTLFRSRILRALDYKQAPFEVAVDLSGGRRRGRKVYGLSPPVGAFLVDRFPEHGIPSGAVYLSCGDSAATDLPDDSVDLVVTDPPFFDNVHYSELADFFYVWQELYFGAGQRDEAASTRTLGEVQDTDPVEFSGKLRDVFCECFRVLKNRGLLVFSYHHSRDDGWSSLASAVWRSGFVVVAAQPVKAEMAGATPKRSAKSPIDLDVLLVCRKRATSVGGRDGAAHPPLARAVAEASAQIEKFNARGRSLSKNDVRVVLSSQLIVALSSRPSEDALAELAGLAEDIRGKTDELFAAQESPSEESTAHDPQLHLSFR